MLPRFVALFLVMVTVRSTGFLSPDLLDSMKTLERFTLASALVGLGAGVRLTEMRTLGLRPLFLGLTSWILVMAVSAVAIGFLPPYAV